MKKLFSLFLFLFLFTPPFLFNNVQKTHAYSLCQTNSSSITCRTGTITWSCPTSWVCACTPAYVYASGGSRCTSSSTYSEPVGFKGSDGKYHSCYFAKIIPFSSSCGSYTSPTLTRSTKCNSSYQSTVTFNWTGVKDANGYQVGWTGGTPVTVGSSTRSYTAVVTSNTSISWWIKIRNEIGWFGQKSGTTITSATCSAPAPTATTAPQAPTATLVPAPPTTTTAPPPPTATPGPTARPAPTARPIPPEPPITDCGSSIFAQYASDEVPTGGLCMLSKIIPIFLNMLFVTSIALAVIFLIWGGINWIMSEGDKQKLSQAKKKIEFAVIGLVIALGSYFVISFILSFFKIKNYF